MYYLIKRGSHRSKQSKLSFTFDKRQIYTVQFNDTAQYEIEGENKEDINKLFGFSDGWSFHHRNSARIGWRWNSTNKLVELFAYVYREGKKYTEYITSVRLYERVRCTIECSDNVYRFYIKDKYHIIPRKPTWNYCLKYRLFPYFGGNEVAPRSITIWMDEIKKRKKR